RGDYIFHCEAGIFEDCLVRVDRRAVRPLNDNGLGYGVGNPPKFPFLLPQLLFHLPEVVNIRIGSIPSDNLAGLALQGFDSDEEPAVGSIVAAETRFHFASFSRSYQRPPLVLPLRQIFGMNYDFTPHALYFFGRETRVVAPSLVNKLVGTIWQIAPGKRG